MSKVVKTLNRVLRGNADANIRFDDLRALLVHLGLAERIRGDHQSSAATAWRKSLTSSRAGGEAKAYQAKQVRAVITSYGLAGEPEEASGEEAGPPGAEENDAR